jgi:4-amino-4-deoxy-L-arabinose transferase-like glycosyltransferase
MPSPKEHSRFRHIYLAGLLALITGTCLAPFLHKAIHLDDPVFLWSAQRIANHPFDPFGITVNWYGTPTSLAEITQNPPVVSYYLAIKGSLTGWNELGLHLALALPAILIVVGTYVLARQFCSQPELAALIVLATPIFLVSSTTLMCDITMLCIWIWAMIFWLRGLERSNPATLILAGVLIAAAALTKYFGACLIPLLFTYSLLRERRLGAWALPLLIPMIALAGYDWFTATTYGRAMFSGAGSYAVAVPRNTTLLLRSLTTLSFAGGGIIAVLCFAPLLWSWRKLAILLLIALGVFCALVFTPNIGRFTLRNQAGELRWLALIQLAAFVASGAGIVILVLRDLRRHQDASSALLALWTGGVLLFAAVFNWTVNGRTLLPMVPAVAILIVRQIEQRSLNKSLPALWHYALPLIPAGLITLCCAYADTVHAATARTAATTICAQYRAPSSTIWFQGHWGFQYYMEANGAKPLDFSTPGKVLPGDIVIIPDNSTNAIAVPLPPARKIATIQQRTCRWLAVMDSAVGAGFYSASWGPLPYAFGTVPPENYEIWLYPETVSPAVP